MKLLQEAMAASSTEALMDKVSQALSAQNIYADIWPTGKDSFAVYISWGDWKHDHLHADLIIEETLKDIDFSIEKEITEEDDSDTYSAIHNVTVYPPKANLDELEEDGHDAVNKHNIRTARLVTTRWKDDEGIKHAEIEDKIDTGKTRTNDRITRFRGGGVIKDGTIYDDKGQKLGKGFISSGKRTSKVFKPAGKEQYVQLPGKNSKIPEKDESKMNQHSNTTVTESTMNDFNIEVNGRILEDKFGNPHHFKTFDEAQAYINEMKLENASVIGKVDTAVTGIVNEKFTDNSAKVDTNLVTELKEKIKEFESRGFEDEDLQIQVDGNYIWFLGELSYKTQAKLADELNIILQKYDKDAYFDAEDNGRWFAIVNESSLTEDVQEEQPKAYIHFKDRRKGEIVKIVAEAGLSDILVIENDKVYGDDETLYKLAQFITPMSDEEKLEIVKENLRALRERKESYKGWNVGDKIKIIDMAGEPEYSGKEGIILFIDDIGQLHGTWGGLAVNLDVDQIKLLSSIADTEELEESFGDADIEKCKFEITIIPNENANLEVFNNLTHHMDYLVDINESKYTFWDVNVDITDNLIKVTGTIEGHGCQQLEEHINTEGWPEISSIEVNVYKENIEESLVNAESIPDAVTPGPDSGIASVLNSLIIDEWEAIQGYNDAIVTAEVEGYHDIAKVLKDIVNEELNHVGMLETSLSLISPNTQTIKDGEEEASEILEQLTESTDAKQSWLKEMAQTDWDVGHTFGPYDFHEFKKIAKECGFDVNEKDFEKYFEYLEDIRAEHYNSDMDESIKK